MKKHRVLLATVLGLTGSLQAQAAAIQCAIVHKTPASFYSQNYAPITPAHTIKDAKLTERVSAIPVAKGAKAPRRSLLFKKPLRT